MRSGFSIVALCVTCSDTSASKHASYLLTDKLLTYFFFLNADKQLQSVLSVIVVTWVAFSRYFNLSTTSECSKKKKKLILLVQCYFSCVVHEKWCYFLTGFDRQSALSISILSSEVSFFCYRPKENKILVVLRAGKCSSLSLNNLLVISCFSFPFQNYWWRNTSGEKVFKAEHVKMFHRHWGFVSVPGRLCVLCFISKHRLLDSENIVFLSGRFSSHLSLQTSITCSLVFKQPGY